MARAKNAAGEDKLTERRIGEKELLGIDRPTPEEEEATARKLAERIELRRLFIVAQMENPMFREWLMEQLVALGTFENAFGAGPSGFPDHMATQFQLGRKAAGWDLWTLFDNAAPELASMMRREYGKSIRPTP